MRTLKLTYRIADHDLNVKLNHARKFLDAKEQVKFMVQLRGREIHNPIKTDGRIVSTIIMPGKIK